MPDTSSQRVNINLPITTILKVVGVLVGVGFLYLVRDIAVVVFISLLLATALEPAVSAMQRWRLPRVVGAAAIYLAAFFLFSLTVVLLAPLVVEEIGSISSNFPLYWERLTAGWLKADPRFHETVQGALDSLRSTFSQAAGNVFGFISVVFGNLVSFILVLVLTFYLLVQEDVVRRTAVALTPKPKQEYVADLIARMQKRLSAWLRGVVLLGLIIGGMVLVGLRILNVRYYLVLALVAGIFEVIPYLGPILAAIPAIFFAATDSLWKGIAVLALYWIIQQMENHLIVPKVMQRAVGLNPVVIIISILIGAKLAEFSGISRVAGILVAVPTAAALSVWLKDVAERKAGNRSPATSVRAADDATDAGRGGPGVL